MEEGGRCFFLLTCNVYFLIKQVTADRYDQGTDDDTQALAILVDEMLRAPDRFLDADFLFLLSFSHFVQINKAAK